MEVLRLHEWPGNIRELQNLIERAVLLTEGRVLQAPLMERTCLKPSASSEPARTLAEIERVHITETLQKANWVVGGRTGAAAILGLPRTTLIARMRKLGISRDTFELAGSPLADQMQHEDPRGAFAYSAGI